MTEAESQSAARPTAADDPLLGRVLSGRFRIIAAIGSGGMGKVYKAMQAPLDRVVAVKVLHPHYSGQDTGFVKRFILEASLTAKLRHPNTVTVIDYGKTDDGVFYIAMELLDGRTLAELIHKQGPLEWQRAVQIGQQICRSLREAHRFGILHRDLKPANVMLLDEADHDVVKVLDFGLVKSFLPDGQPSSPEITQSGLILGSPQYMAPEQARQQSDPRSDVYSFGVLLFEMLTSRPPFQAKDYLEVIVKHLKETPPLPSTVRPDAQIPAAIEAVVMRCLQKEPAGRYQTMDEVLDALRAAGGSSGYLGHLESRPAIPAVSPQPGTPPPLPVRPGLITPNLERVPSAQETPAPFQQRRNPLPQRPPPAPEARQPLFASVTQPQRVFGGAPSAQDVSGLPSSSSDARRRSIGLWVSLGAAAFCVGTISYGFLGRSKAVSDAPALGSSATASSSPGAGKSVRFRVSSEPAGARVFTGARDLGLTPLEFEVPSQGDGTVTAELIFVLDGYHPLAVTAGGSGEVVLTQRLQKKSGRAALPVSVREAASNQAASKTKGSTVERGARQAPPADSSGGTQPNDTPGPPSVGTAATVTPKTLLGATVDSAAPVSDAQPVSTPEAATAPAAEVAAPATPGVDVIPFGEGMNRPEQLEDGKPIDYPREAIEAQVAGLMIVKCVISVAGRVENCRVLKGLPYMEQPVLDSLYSRLYKPVTFQGKPTAVDYVFDLQLELPKH